MPARLAVLVDQVLTITRWGEATPCAGLVALEIDGQAVSAGRLGRTPLDSRRSKMAHPNEVLVREAFAAFSRGDTDALRRQYWAEDIRLHVPGRSPIAGDYEGPAQVLGWLGRLFESSGGTYSIELHDVLVSSGRNAMRVQAASVDVHCCRPLTATVVTRRRPSVFQENC